MIFITHLLLTTWEQADTKPEGSGYNMEVCTASTIKLSRKCMNMKSEIFFFTKNNPVIKNKCQIKKCKNLTVTLM